MLQAMAELNIRSGIDALSMDELEAFWDSEAPRIGDAHPSLAGAAKWRENASTPSVKPPSQQPLQPGAGHAVRFASDRVLGQQSMSWTWKENTGQRVALGIPF